jgi:hypothetical protein
MPTHVHHVFANRLPQVPVKGGDNVMLSIIYKGNETPPGHEFPPLAERCHRSGSRAIVHKRSVAKKLKCTVSNFAKFASTLYFMPVPAIATEQRCP